METSALVSNIFSAGDTDILRDAHRASNIFWARVRGAPLWLAGGAALTALLGLVIAILVLGPQGTGLRWASRDIFGTILSAVGVIWAVYSGYLVFKFMPSRNDRVVLELRNWVRTQVQPLEERVQKLSDDELRAKRRELTERLARGETLDDIRAEAYACVREASRRARAHRQFECQLIGGRVIERCNIAEMRTGEGKTIVCYMANYMKVLQGLKVHMVTVNDYLVKRDADFCRPIFELLGMTVGYITADMPTWGPGVEVRRQAYACDITYGTNSEFGFDYLRDHMKTSVRDQVQGRQDFVVVDEVDSILIDEARTPLIISGPAHDDVDNYRVADNIARVLVRRQEQANREMLSRLPEIEAEAPAAVKSDAKFKSGIKKFRADPLLLSSDEAEAIGHKQYFVVELDRKSAHMTEEGARAAQAELGIGTFYDSRNMNWPHYIDNALKAHLCYRRDKEYVIQDGQIIIVDEFTGRLMHGRQWSDGLHQAVEAKEKVTIKQESQTLATITLQNLFKLYKHLAGMTGTAMTEADEFMKIYKLEVIAIPTNKPVRRVDYNDKIYKSTQNKYDAIVEEIHAYSFKGYPADPWSLYDMLKQGRRRLAELRRTREGDGQIPAYIARIDAALAAFGDGSGDPAALEQTYLELVGHRVGGRPLLVGTVSVENSERLSQMLTRRYGIDHEVLNAKNHAREAEIVAKAGQQHPVTRGKQTLTVGNVTIATNMAGRGTDIVLGPGVAEIGGLHVVGTERHESRRIDNQLRGRCGRQGDPGSSRFFLSLEDDLLKLFMPEWMLNMLSRYGMVEGVPIESRQLTRNIEAAQKKVEERNFGIRKNLLEYDEVMDYQRRTFYELRQRVVERWIDETVADAVDRFYDPQFPALCAAEWVSQNLGVSIEARKLDTVDLTGLCERVRDLATAEVRGNVERTFGEYVDPEVEPEEWDMRGLVGWAAQFGLTLTQRQVRETDPAQLLEQLVEAAVHKVEQTDLSPLEPFVEPLFGRSRLIRWAHEKFGVSIPLDDLATASREDAERIIAERMRAAYRRREVEYPVGAVIQYAIQRGGTNVNEVYNRIAAWVNRKYRLGWTYEHFEGKSPQEIFQELRAINEDYLRNGKIEGEIDQALREHAGSEIVQWARERFGSVVDGQSLAAGPELRGKLLRCGYEMLRYELTQLERLVVLSTLDAVWKDHMYAMDLLRHGIHLRGYAERDPKIEYKREGTRLFNETMSNIRERVTDMIFKVELVMAGDEPGGPDDGGGVPVPAGGGPYSGMAASKADATGAAFSNVAADRAAAMRQQGEGGKPQTIRRETPRVGRNDPCPCGSGKKFKQCHGKGR
jgi:preprotein translocase subunit SecA